MTTAEHMVLTAVTQGSRSFPGCLVTGAEEESYMERKAGRRQPQSCIEWTLEQWRCQKLSISVSAQVFPSFSMIAHAEAFPWLPVNFDEHVVPRKDHYSHLYSSLDTNEPSLNYF